MNVRHAAVIGSTVSVVALGWLSTSTLSRSLDDEQVAPAARTSFHDFHLGMTRGEAHEKLQAWDVWTSRFVTEDMDGWSGLPERPDAGISAFRMVFDDGAGLVFNNGKSRPSKSGERREYALLPAAALSYELTDAKLTFMTFEFTEKEGPADAFLALCEQQFGKPASRNTSRELVGFSMHRQTGQTVPLREVKQHAVWHWPARDERVTVQTIMDEKVGVRDEPRFRAVISFWRGARTHELLQEALRNERVRRQRQEAARALGADEEPFVGVWLPGKSAHAPSAPVHGMWRVVAQDEYGWQWRGLLQLEPLHRDPPVVKGRIEWLEGVTLGVQDLVGALYSVTDASGVRCTLLQCAASRGDEQIGVYLAALTDDHRLVAGEFEHTGMLRWAARRVTDEFEPPPPSPTPAGVWMLSDKRTLEVSVGDRALEFSRVNARLRAGSAVTHLAGSYNHRTHRLWLSLPRTMRMIPQNTDEVFAIAADLSTDGERLAGHTTDGRYLDGPPGPGKLFFTRAWTAQKAPTKP